MPRTTKAKIVELPGVDNAPQTIEPVPSIPEPPAPVPDATVALPRATKQALVLNMLKRKKGVTLDELVKATNWLPHTTRAALTGLRKKGHAIATEKGDGPTRYRIAA